MTIGADLRYQDGYRRLSQVQWIEDRDGKPHRSQKTVAVNSRCSTEWLLIWLAGLMSQLNESAEWKALHGSTSVIKEWS
jgi:hypothetical protein